MSNFGAETKFDKSKNYTEVKFGHRKPVLETELNLLQEIQNEARADIIRNKAHSGFIKMSELEFPHNKRNTVILKDESVANINGYLITIPAGTEITLDEPPTHGYREDLVFLEAWFEYVDYEDDPDIFDSRIGIETSRRKKLNWRIRSVAGVDFNRYTKGLGYTYDNNTWEAYAVAQGGNEETPNYPLVSTNGTTQEMFYSAGNRRSSKLDSRAIYKDDEGLYIAGDGTQQSKDLLKTADGYVYAIPLFRVKRRNSGGYREDNVDGANEYKEDVLNYSFGKLVSTYEVIENVYFDTNMSINVGDILVRKINPSYKLKILSKNANGTCNVKNLGLATSISESFEYFIQSDRPDNLYANIIDERDVVDLRHKVSLNGYDYQQMLEENFDKLLRGELQTKDKTTMMKEQFNLKPAPAGTPVQLMPVEVKVPNFLDNPEETDPMKVEFYSKSLVNLLGHNGNFENGLNGWYTTNDNEVGRITSAEKYSGKQSVHLGADKVRNIYYTLNDIKNKHILIGFYAKINKELVVHTRGTVTNLFVKNIPANTGWTYYSILVEKGQWEDGTGLRFYSEDAYVDDVSVYEIDQETFDKIGDLSDEQIAMMFPYVSSYPNVVENLLPSRETESQVVEIIRNSDYDFNLTWNDGFHFYWEVVLQKDVDYYFYINSSSNNIQFILRDTDNNTITYVARPLIKAGGFEFSFRVNETRKYRVSLIRHTSTGSTRIRDWYLSKYPFSFHVPYGRWELPYDVMEGNTPIRNDLKDRRLTLSDAQSVDNVSELISPVGDNPSYIETNQQTPGEWSVGDTITIKSDKGVIAGRYNPDMAVAKVISYADGKTNGNETQDMSKVILDKVDKLEVGDEIVLYNTITGFTASSRTITEIDVENKIVTFGENVELSAISDYILIEVTEHSSSPIIRTETNGISGTWSGLGTKEATFTINNVASGSKNVDILIQHSLFYPAGQGIKELPKEILGAEVNGIEYEKNETGIHTTVASFEGKVRGDTNLVPHIAYRVGRNSLIEPSELSSIMEEQPNYDLISKRDGKIREYKPLNQTEGTIAQQVFSFDIVRHLEDMYGSRIFKSCLTLEEKVGVARELIRKITCHWYGYGSSPNGNKAFATMWLASESNWGYGGALYTHEKDTVSELKIGISTSYILATPKNCIDSDGFLHFIVYTEPSDGETPSAIYTDYIELEVEVDFGEEGYEVLTPAGDSKPVLVDDPSMFKEGENMIPPFTDVRWNVSPEANIISPYELEIPENKIGLTANNEVTIQVEPYTDYTLLFEDRLNGRLGILGNNQSITFYPTESEMLRRFNTNSNTEIKIMFDKVSSFSGRVLFKKPMLTKGSEPKPFVPYNKDVKRRKKFDFFGKVAGSTWENPHKAYIVKQDASDPSFQVAEEINQTAYDNLAKADGNLHYTTTTNNENYAQQLFEFDLSHLGLSLKELMKAIQRISVEWTGYGSGADNGSKAYGVQIKVWNARDERWSGTTTGTKDSPETLTINYYTATTSRPLITTDQKIGILVQSTYPSDGTIPSEVYTDYIKLEVKLADYIDYVPHNILLTRKETKEIKTVFPTKDRRRGETDVIKLWYDYVPYQLDTLGYDLKLKQRGEHAYVTIAGTNRPYDTVAPRNNSIARLLGADHELNYKAEAYKTLMKDLQHSSLEPVKGYERMVHFGDILHSAVNIVRYTTKPEWLEGFPANTFVYAVPNIVEYRGQLYLQVIVRSEYYTHVELIGGGLWLAVPIEGRPLLKEGN